VHAAEGNVLLYRSLAAHLGADQPVFGLQSAGLDGRSPVDGRFEHVARRYVDEIRQVQPHGPYMLGGYCMGGTLALEMARQLIASGETVGLVALIEIYNLRAMRWPLPLHQRFTNRFILNPYFHLQNLFAAEGAGKLTFFMEKLRVEITRMKASARLGWAHLRHRLLPDAAATTPHARIADIYEEALAQYDVRPYPGELTLFLAERHLAGYHAHLGGWGEVAQGGVRLFSLPISPRGSLVEPYVGQLAALLRSCLDRAIENSKDAVPEPGLEPVSAP
jgi:thioesterase domain-containing protein